MCFRCGKRFRGIYKAVRNPARQGWSRGKGKEMSEYEDVEQKIIAAVLENIPGALDEEERMKIAVKIADTAMDAVLENYRSISEICDITDAVRAGIDMEIAYADPEEEPNPFIYRAHY